MKKLMALTVLTISFAGASAFAESFTGVVSDAMCAKNPATASSPDKIAPFAGKTITVDGSVVANTITVSSVK